MKNKILLISPYFKDGLSGFPLGLSYVAGALRQAGHDVYVLDLTAKSCIESREYEKILEDELYRINPVVVGITSTSPTHKNALEVARIVKRFGDIPIIKGGPHETNCAETTIKNNPEIDYSVVGEGEETITELVGSILNENPVKGIRGVVYRDGDSVISNGRRQLIQDLDRLPRPAWDLFYINRQLEQYYSARLFEGKKSTHIMASRGCEYCCSFCSSKTIWGGLRYRSVDNVIDELKDLHSKGFEGFGFEDDMGLVNRGWILDFARKIKSDGLNIEYFLQTRVDIMDEDVTRALAESGCIFLYFGIETGVQTILDKCGKGITIQQAKEAYDLLRKYGIRNMASIQFGLPGEDLERLSTVKETIRILNDVLRPDDVVVSYTSFYPGSPLAKHEGVTPDIYEEYISSLRDDDIHSQTGHGNCSIHPIELTTKKIKEIEGLLERELRIRRFDLNELYKI